MIEDMNKILMDRLRQIDAEIVRLKVEKSKTKQALEIFRAGSTEAVSSRVLSKESPVAHEPTFKEKIKLTLKNRYPDGATAREIIEYCNANWVRHIERASLSPQLSRLRNEGVLRNEHEKWILIKGEGVQHTGEPPRKNEAPAVQPASASITGGGDTRPIERFRLDPKPELRASGPTAGREAPPPGKKYVGL